MKKVSPEGGVGMDQEENKQQWDPAQRRELARQERKRRLVNGIIVGVAVLIGLVAAVAGIFLGASDGDKPQQTEPSHAATTGETVSDPTGTAGPTEETEQAATEPKVQDTVIKAGGILSLAPMIYMCLHPKVKEFILNH
jgi:hypothetical protein